MGTTPIETPIVTAVQLVEESEVPREEDEREDFKVARMQTQLEDIQRQNKNSRKLYVTIAVVVLVVIVVFVVAFGVAVTRRVGKAALGEDCAEFSIGTQRITDIATSTLPTCLGQLTQLTQLNLAVEGLTGTIPTELGQLTLLTYLHLSSNGLESTIPTELGRLTMLTGLWLYENQLVGTIPTDLERLTALQLFYMENNALTGTIPAWVSDISFHSVSGNNFSGF